MKKIFILSFIFILGIHVNAQTHENWLNYTSSHRVTDIDIKGDSLWISTQGGLVKYDKQTGEKTFYNRANSNLPDNNLLGVSCVENGDVWVGGKYYGIGKFDGSSCTIYNESNSDLPSDQHNSRIKLDDEGNVWISSFRWMVKYNGSEWKTWITGSDISQWPGISDFDITDDGIVWIFSSDGIGKIENDEYTIVSTIGSGINTLNGYVKIDNEGVVWVAVEGEGKGIYKYDGTSFTNYNTSNSCLPTNRINAIDFDSDNKMWLATGEGLVSFDASDCETFKPSVENETLLSIVCDKDNVVWCGTFNGKLLKFDGSNFSTIELSNSPLKSNRTFPMLNDAENTTWIGSNKNTVKATPSSMYSEYERGSQAGIETSNGDIWLGFNSGDTCLLKISDNGNTVFDSLNSPFNTNSYVTISSLAEDNNGNMWISTRYGGLYKYDGTDFTNYTTKNCDIPSDEIFDLKFDNNNNLWGGTAQGLFKFYGSNWAVWNEVNSDIATNCVNNLIIDIDDKIWFSCMDEDRVIGLTFGGGLTKFDGQTMTTYNISNSGLLSNTIFGILDDGDKLWIAAYGAGLMSFDKTNEWEAFDETNSGISSDWVQKLVKDKNGSIWMGHLDAGVSVFNPDLAIQTGVNIIEEEVAPELDGGIDITIYPNPVRDNMYLSLNLQDEKILKAGIYDVNGKLLQVVSEDVFNSKQDIYSIKIKSDLPEKQFLILSLISDKGNTYRDKFIVLK